MTTQPMTEERLNQIVEAVNYLDESNASILASSYRKAVLELVDEVRRLRADIQKLGGLRPGEVESLRSDVAAAWRQIERVKGDVLEVVRNMPVSIDKQYLVDALVEKKILKKKVAP